MTTNPPKRKQLLISAPVGAGGMIPIHHSMKIINPADWYWYITASGHLGNQIEDSRNIDFSHEDFYCLGL